MVLFTHLTVAQIKKIMDEILNLVYQDCLDGKVFNEQDLRTSIYYHCRNSEIESVFLEVPRKTKDCRIDYRVDLVISGQKKIYVLMEIKCDTTNWDNPNEGNQQPLDYLTEDIDKLQYYKEYKTELNLSTEVLGYFVYFCTRNFDQYPLNEFISYFEDNRKLWRNGYLNVYLISWQGKRMKKWQY
jgi:hypothetical protein